MLMICKANEELEKLYNINCTMLLKPTIYVRLCNESEGRGKSLDLAYLLIGRSGASQLARDICMH